MDRRTLLFSIFTASALMLNSCGGGGGTTSSDSSQSGEKFTSVTPEVIETSDGVVVRAEKGNQVLEVYIPGAVVSKNSLNNLSVLALSDIGTAQEVKLPVGNESFNISFSDPDPYDNTIYIGFKSQNKNIDFTGAYDTNKATLITGNFDVFSSYFQVPKDSNTNKATLNLNFGNKLYNEGESDNIVIGGWDTLNEGVKYTLPVRKDDLADVSLDSNNTNCPYDFDNNSNVIYLPTRTDTGNVYTKTHCVSFVITPGNDDSNDNDSTTVNVYEGTSTTPNAVLVNNQVMNGNVSKVYNLTSNLNANNTKDLKVEVKANLGGDANKVSSKVYNFTLKGDPSNVVIKACLTGDLSATDCVPGPQGDPAGSIIANTYQFVGTVDVNNDGDPDYGKYCINNDLCILYDGGSYYVIPSTGAKLFFKVDNTSTVVNGRPYEFDLWKDGSVVKTYSTTNPLSFSKVYTLGSTEDLNNDQIQVVDCSSGGWTLVGVDSYKVFNNYKNAG